MVECQNSVEVEGIGIKVFTLSFLLLTLQCVFKNVKSCWMLQFCFQNLQVFSSSR